jgi:hypothetical protein
VSELPDPAVVMMATTMRRTVISATLMGVGLVLVALAEFPPLSAVGLPIGVLGAWYNIRFLDRSIGKLEVDPDQPMKVLRKRVRGGVTLRLAILTAVVLGLVILSRPLGFGALVGLMVFQFCFIVNLSRASLASGKTE